MPGVRANVAPWTLLLVYKTDRKRPITRPIRYSYDMLGTNKGNRAARRIIPLLKPTSVDHVTCSWLQALPKGPEGQRRFHRDGWCIRRALTLSRPEPAKPEEGLFGSSPKNPVLVATVKSRRIILDLHLGKHETETTDFEPAGLVEALVAAAKTCPTDKLRGYAMEIAKDGRDAQNGKGSPLSECFKEAIRHAVKSFGLEALGPHWTAGLCEIGPFESPTAHPLQRVFRTTQIF
jgi:hypothetical protein